MQDIEDLKAAFLRENVKQENWKRLYACDLLFFLFAFLFLFFLSKILHIGDVATMLRMAVFL